MSWAQELQGQGRPFRTLSGCPGNASVDFHRERRSNATHASTTDPECRLCKKSKGAGAQLCDMGNVPMENRHGLVVKPTVTQANGKAERDAALNIVQAMPRNRRVTLGGDKN